MTYQKRTGFKVFGFQIDIARQIEKPQVIRDAVMGMHELGYNVCQVYLEDAYCFESHPGIARKHAYTKEFMQEIQSLCKQQQMEFIPVIPSLGHCDYITHKPGYKRFDEGRGTENNHGTLSPSFPETYDLLRELYKDWCDHIPGRYLHVGLDESVTMGNYHIRTYGKESFDAAEMFARHCNKINAICKSLGRQMLIWGDMFYYMANAINLIDKDIIVVDWYYYTFGKTTRIEQYNFADVDLSGDLKKAGLEVWGCPAVWPNFPIADVQDRWDALCDWIRYGTEKKIDGILITDWENSIGFYSNSDLLFRAFGLNAIKEKHEPIEKEIFNVLKEKLQVSDNNQHLKTFVCDLMQIGRYHVTGHQNRRLYLWPLEILSSKNRQAECKQKYEELKKLFTNVPQLLQDSKTEEGRDIINGLYQSYKFLLVLWKFGAILPDCYQWLCRNDPSSDKDAKSEMLELASDAQELFDEYNAHWLKVRFGNGQNSDGKSLVDVFKTDPQPVGVWATNAVKKLQQWVDAIDAPNRDGHPFVATPRIECTLHCHHPALPVAMFTAMWDDGHTLMVNETILCFESKYSAPNVKWQQFPSIFLDRRELPNSIKIDSNNYGQIGVENVYIIWKGIKYAYKPVKTEGCNIKKDGDILWLGPVCATVESPLLREDHDIAWFEMV